MIGNAIAGLYGVGVTPSTTAYESIATSTPSAQSSITFNSIPSTFKHLQIRFSLVGSTANRLGVRVNGDSASNYSFHYLVGNGTSPFAGGSANYDQLSILYYGRTKVTNPTVGIFDLLDYASTDKYKTSRSLTGVDDNGASAGYVEFESGSWRSTSAVTSLEFITNTGTFTGSIALYGIKG